MTVAVFDPTAFKAKYPEFSGVSDAVLGEYFLDACLYLDNTDASIVQDVAKRLRYLNMLTAHLLKLGGLAGTVAGSTTSSSGSQGVGLLNSATEGSVSVGYDTSHIPSGSAAWYAQTQYGYAYWQAMAPYRSFRYVANPTVY